MEEFRITRRQLCSMIDHTNLKPYAVREDFEKLCREARENNFAMVAINPAPVRLCRELLEGSGVHVGAAVSFPLGQDTLAAKIFCAEDAIQNGADEIDYVLNIGELKAGNRDYIEKEMKELTSLCRSSNVISKVIFEICYLTEQEIRIAAEAAKVIGPDYIKTSTGFGNSGADAHAVRLMKEEAGEAVKVKAAGRIRDWKTCREMILAGAERIGTSSSLRILKEYGQENIEQGEG